MSSFVVSTFRVSKLITSKEQQGVEAIIADLPSRETFRIVSLNLMTSMF